MVAKTFAGLEEILAGELNEIGAENVKVLFNILPEAAKYLADRDIESVAKSTVFNNRPTTINTRRGFSCFFINFFILCRFRNTRAQRATRGQCSHTRHRG